MEKISGIVCSTAHFTIEDNERLSWLCDSDNGPKIDWIHNTGYGYLIQLNAYRYPSIAFREWGMSRGFRWFIVTMMRREKLNIINFDKDAECIDGFAVFDW